MHFSHISHWYLTKNKLEEAILAFLKSKDRQVISNEDLKAFQTEVLDGMHALNLKHPRCKPIHGRFDKGEWMGFTDCQLMLSGSTLCIFKIYSTARKGS